MSRSSTTTRTIRCCPRRFNQGGYNIAFVNNGFYQTDRIMNIFWAGVKYAVTPTLDVMGAYYGYRQNNFLQSSQPGTSLVNPAIGGGYGGINPANVGCTSSAFAGCSGSMDMVSLAMDWRFAQAHGPLRWRKCIRKSRAVSPTATFSPLQTPLWPATFNTFNKVSDVRPGHRSALPVLMVG